MASPPRGKERSDRSDMPLSLFIRENLESLLDEWESSVRNLGPPADRLPPSELRDHHREILLAIASEIAAQGGERADDSQQTVPSAAHGAVRQLDGFNLIQITAEYRVMRVTVLSRWRASLKELTTSAFEEQTLFNAHIDRALATSIAAYADRIDKSRDTFLAVLGHDLRGPLSTISVGLEVIGRSEGVPEPVIKAADMAKRNISTIKELIADLLEYTRTRLGKGLPIVRAPVDLSALCREAVLDIQAAHPRRTIEPQIASGVICAVDAARIRQLVLNLLDNALKYGAPDQPIGISLRSGASMIKLAVRNYGPPIPSLARRVIFDPLVQLPISPSRPAADRHVGGLGLGLYIAREIANGHGGMISVKSSPHRGTIFTVRIPVPSQEDATAQ